MSPTPLIPFVKKWQPKVGLAGYDILFTYFKVEVKSKMKNPLWEISISVICHLTIENGTFTTSMYHKSTCQPKKTLHGGIL